MRYRLTRIVAATALLASSLMLAGGALVTTASPSAAAVGGTNVCASFVATFDPSTGLSTGRLSGCHQQGSGTTVETPNLADPFAPNPLTINWATGHATSDIIVSTGPTQGIRVQWVTLLGRSRSRSYTGPYSGSTGGYVICLDFTDPPLIHATNVGPVVI